MVVDRWRSAQPVLVLLMKRLLLAGVAALSMVTSAAHADEKCATVLKTEDGFLALREKPSAQSKMIAKLLQGDYLVKIDRQVDIWRHVTEKRGYTEGWVSNKYIKEFACPSPEEDWNGRLYKDNVPRALLGQWCSAWADRHYERCDNITKREIRKLVVAEGYVDIIRITPDGITAEGQSCKGIFAIESEGAQAYTLKLQCPKGEKTLRVDMENIRKGIMKVDEDDGSKTKPETSPSSAMPGLSSQIPTLSDEKPQGDGVR